MSERDAQADDFRAEVRAWLAENFPRSLAFKNPVPYQNDAPYAEADPDFRLWRARLAEKRWGAPGWPVEVGGGGLDTAQVKIISEEMARIGAFSPMRMTGLTMLGPTLMEFGTAEQQARHLPPIARGELRWCQGFSEPGAGSDLAALQTKCIDMGDHWRVNGQKIWTSGANHSNWCFALVRTDTTRKQGGISFLLIDMILSQRRTLDRRIGLAQAGKDRVTAARERLRREAPEAILARVKELDEARQQAIYARDYKGHNPVHRLGWLQENVKRLSGLRVPTALDLDDLDQYRAELAQREEKLTLAELELEELEQRMIAE